MTDNQSSSAETPITHRPAANPAASVSPNYQAKILRYTLLGLVLLAIVAYALWKMRPVELHGTTLQTPRPLDDFTLTASTGEPMSLSDFRGQYLLVYFGYTFCPDICPFTLSDLAQMARQLGPERMEKVQVLLITTDPERDTPQQLATYVAQFDPSFLGMTGSLDDIQQVASQFGIFFQKQEGTAATGYLVDHTSAVIVVDPNGAMRHIFPNGTSAEDMASDMLYLMRN